MLKTLKECNVTKRIFPRIIGGKIFTNKIDSDYLVSKDGLYNLETKKFEPFTALKGLTVFPDKVDVLEKALEPLGLGLEKFYGTYSVVDAYGYDGSVELSHEESYVVWKIGERR